MVAQDGVVGSSAIGKWLKALGELHRRIGHRFCRSEAKERVHRYLVGLLGRIERSLKYGWRVMSSYPVGADGERVWIITEADRSSTCLLLPEEY